MNLKLSANCAVSPRLQGKVAIVTGGASGIGASAVSLFNDHGAKVVIADIQDDLGNALAESLGPDVTYIHCDVTDEDHVHGLVDAAVAKHGRVDIMYSNAGVVERTTSIVDVDKGELQRTLSVNLAGAFLAAKHAARVMAPARKGCIIFTASACTEVAGIAGHAYVASKYGIVGLMKSLAVELGSHGIRANCVSPFGVLTGIAARDEKTKLMFDGMMSAVGNLKGKILTAEDVAKAALYLASEEASYVSGLNLVVDGGYSVVNPTLNNIMSAGQS
ncbi:tropinone reductase-like 1 [Salvia splendens]|uniref:tropinone reductase-like 1 n=1 Tax=Salvia splendens TaxID=180675 RepID=UPI001C2527FE|nr:tropinone reductase-like 1 [Salvia splendens]